MLLCLTCLQQKPNKYKNYSCPKCSSFLKYVEGPAKNTVIKLHKAGISVSYATAEVYSYSNHSVHTANVVLGLAQPYQSIVFRGLPSGIGYVLPRSHKAIGHVPADHILSPVRTYGLIRYEVPYLDYKEARTMLRQKLKELDNWVDESVEWLSICNLGGLL